MKYLEENIGKTLFVINHKIFLDPPPNENKNKNKQRVLIKLKSFCPTKETINKTRNKFKQVLKDCKLKTVRH